MVKHISSSVLGRLVVAGAVLMLVGRAVQADPPADSVLAHSPTKALKPDLSHGRASKLAPPADQRPHAPAPDANTLNLAEATRMAEQAYVQMNRNIRDYTCLLTKRENVNGIVGSHQYMRVKVRHEQIQDGRVIVPFSVYLHYLKPEDVVGRRVLYVQGRDNDRMLVRRGGVRNSNMTLHLPLDSPLVTKENRYPITEIGFENLAARLVVALLDEQRNQNGEITVNRNAKVKGKGCTYYRLTQKRQLLGLDYYQAEVCVDNVLGLPVYFRSHDWPTTPDAAPVLLEEYYYSDVQLNAGLTDADFDPTNPVLGFPQ